jgi:hypothetical protein
MSSRKALLAIVFVLAVASMACNPLSFLATKTPTETPTPTATDTPTNTPTFTPSNTPEATATNTKNPKFVDTSGDITFAYTPPDGWEQASSKNSDAGWNGPNGEWLDFMLIPDNGLSPEDWSAELVVYYQENIPDLQLVGAEAFYPDSGLEAFMVAMEYESSGTKIHENVYFFASSGYILMVDYLRYQDDDSQDNVIDDCMKSVEMDIG